MMRGSNMGILPLRLILLWSLGGFLLIGHSYQYPLDRRNAKTYMVTWGFLFKHRSYSNQREHSCRYPFDWQTAEPTWGLLDRIRIIAQPLWESTWIVFESASLNNF